MAKGYISNRSSGAYYWNEKRCQLKKDGIKLGQMFKPVGQCALRIKQLDSKEIAEGGDLSATSVALRGD